MHVMLDLETWGKKPGCAIRSVGAVVFFPEAGALGETFYRNVSDASCEALGLAKDPGTVLWWGDQKPEAQAALLIDPQPLEDVLGDFLKWWSQQRAKFVWGHGAAFDPPILEAAFEAALSDAPWKFWDVRCCRTVLAMANRKPLREGGVHHNALDDAKAQARAVMAAFRHKQFSAR